MIKQFFNLVLFFTIFSPNSVYAEELLKINGAEYLGWRISTEEFLPCGSIEKIKIGDGKVISTSRKCDYSPILKTIEGLVSEVDTSNNTLVINTKDGKKTYYYPYASGISSGEKVSVDVPSSKSDLKNSLGNRALSIREEK